jgi:FKBP-type peptidyl-prolyl cis-trans isomerase FkpA
MQKTIMCLLVIALLASSCLKKESGCPYSESSMVAPPSEQTQIETYLSNNGLTAIKHPSGVYYEIVKPGADASPNLCSNIQVAYTGTLTDGSVFDFSNGTVFTLGRLIEGWKKTLPLLKKGGQIKLYVPPALGYQYSDMKDQYGNVVIPASSILIFDITLQAVN